MLIDISLKMTGCLPIASESVLPSVTFCFSSMATSSLMPLPEMLIMLLSATDSGIPERSRFASCSIHVAESCNLGLRPFRRNRIRPPPPSLIGLTAATLAARADFSGFVLAALPLAGWIDTGYRPSRCNLDNAPARSADSSTPCITWPERLRAL